MVNFLKLLVNFFFKDVIHPKKVMLIGHFKTNILYLEKAIDILLSFSSSISLVLVGFDEHIKLSYENLLSKFCSCEFKHYEDLYMCGSKKTEFDDIYIAFMLPDVIFNSLVVGIIDQSLSDVGFFLFLKKNHLTSQFNNNSIKIDYYYDDSIGPGKIFNLSSDGPVDFRTFDIDNCDEEAFLDRFLSVRRHEECSSSQFIVHTVYRYIPNILGIVIPWRNEWVLSHVSPYELISPLCVGSTTKRIGNLIGKNLDNFYYLSIDDVDQFGILHVQRGKIFVITDDVVVYENSFGMPAGRYEFVQIGNEVMISDVIHCSGFNVNYSDNYLVRYDFIRRNFNEIISYSPVVYYDFSSHALIKRDSGFIDEFHSLFHSGTKHYQLFEFQFVGPFNFTSSLRIGLFSVKCSPILASNFGKLYDSSKIDVEISNDYISIYKNVGDHCELLTTIIDEFRYQMCFANCVQKLSISLKHQLGDDDDCYGCCLNPPKYYCFDHDDSVQLINYDSMTRVISKLRYVRGEYCKFPNDRSEYPKAIYCNLGFDAPNVQQFMFNSEIFDCSSHLYQIHSGEFNSNTFPYDMSENAFEIAFPKYVPLVNYQYNEATVNWDEDEDNGEDENVFDQVEIGNLNNLDLKY